jgi:hypothetical protein
MFDGVAANEGYVRSVCGRDARGVFEWLTGHAWVLDGVGLEERIRAVDVGGVRGAIVGVRER